MHNRYKKIFGKKKKMKGMTLDMTMSSDSIRNNNIVLSFFFFQHSSDNGFGSRTVLPLTIGHHVLLPDGHSYIGQAEYLHLCAAARRSRLRALSLLQLHSDQDQSHLAHLQPRRQRNQKTIVHVAQIANRHLLRYVPGKEKKINICPSFEVLP